MKRNVASVGIALGAALVVTFLAASVSGAELDMRSQLAACADVTLLVGSPILTEPDSTQQTLVQGQKVYAGSVLQTDDASRLELTFPDGDRVRMAKNTTIELGAEVKSAEEPGPRFQLVLTGGDIWVNLSSRLRAAGLQLLAAGAVFSGTESVFRATLFPEGDLEVKTYTGKVTTNGPFEIVKKEGYYVLQTFSGAEDIEIEAWHHQMEPYRKMIIMSSGTATPPFRFAERSDLTQWVRWNRQRDAETE